MKGNVCARIQALTLAFLLITYSHIVSADIGCIQAMRGISPTSLCSPLISLQTRRTRSRMATNDIILRIKEQGAAKAGGAISRVTKAIMGLATAYLGYRGVVAAKELGKDLLATYKNQEKAIKRLVTLVKITTVEYKKATKVLMAHADALESIGVVGRSTIIAGQAVLASYQIQATSVKALTEGLADMAVYMANGAEVTQDLMVNAANALAKGLIGLPGMLRRSGISMSQFQMDVLKSGNETERVAMMVDVLAQNVGGLNKEMRETTGGKQQAFTNLMRGLKKLAGKEMADQLKNSLDPLIALVKSPEAKTFATSIGKGFASIIKQVERLGPMLLKVYETYNKIRYGDVVAGAKMREIAARGDAAKYKQSYETDATRIKEIDQMLESGVGDWSALNKEKKRLRGELGGKKARADYYGAIAGTAQGDVKSAMKGGGSPNATLTAIIEGVKTLKEQISGVSFNAWAKSLQAVLTVLNSIAKVVGWTEEAGTYWGNKSVEFENFLRGNEGKGADIMRNVTGSILKDVSGRGKPYSPVPAENTRPTYDPVDEIKKMGDEYSSALSAVAQQAKENADNIKELKFSGVMSY